MGDIDTDTIGLIVLAAVLMIFFIAANGSRRHDAVASKKLPIWTSSTPSFTP